MQNDSHKKISEVKQADSGVLQADPEWTSASTKAKVRTLGPEERAALDGDQVVKENSEAANQLVKTLKPLSGDGEMIFQEGLSLREEFLLSLALGAAKREIQLLRAELQDQLARQRSAYGR